MHQGMTIRRGPGTIESEAHQANLMTYRHQ